MKTSHTHQTLTRPPPGTRMRFVVQSAEEAVSEVRKHLGSEARVLSVGQVSGGGLARFLTSPKLEVIAWIPDTGPQPFSPVLPGPSPTLTETDTKEMIGSEILPEGFRSKESLASRLAKAGLNEPLLEAIIGPGTLHKLEQLSPESALTQLRKNLMTSGRNRRIQLKGRSIAFIGPSGSGKTTALCKWLSREVILNRRNAQVLRLDLDVPHFGDGLEAFCEAMGVPCWRDPAMISKDPGCLLLIDIPGGSLKDYRENQILREKLDHLQIEHRILVLDAAYQTSILKSICQQAHILEPTEAIFTRLDQLTSWGKLWPFCFAPHSPILFCSTGPNIASDYIEDVFTSMIHHTLP